MGPGNEEEARRWRGQAVGYSEEAGGGGEALLGGEREREVADAERVRGVVGRVAPGHLPLHQLLRAPHRHGLLRRHFDLRSLGSEFGLERNKRGASGNSAARVNVPGVSVNVHRVGRPITNQRLSRCTENGHPRVWTCPESDEKKKFWMRVSPFSDGCLDQAQLQPANTKMSCNVIYI